MIRTRLVILSAALLLTGSAIAQTTPPPAKDTTLPKPELGIKLGAQMQSINGTAWDNAYKTGIVGGFFAGYHKKKFGVRLEVLASTGRYTATKSKDTSGNPIGLADSVGNLADFKTVTLNIPLLFEYNIIPRLTIQVGPQLNSMLSAKSLNAFPGDAKSLFKQTEFLGVIGIEGKLPMNILLGGRYIYGFSDINDYGQSGSPGTWKTTSIQLYAGYRFQ